ncbi:MAG TPA: TetR/AcrR family transcriptional regulator [Streptosporangiaceae bacterium]|jgi:AcrR family transcriptional regulator|nr:TetR/AcrR family transcriptional regulator [Streptosporangiaceae bacterium]
MTGLREQKKVRTRAALAGAASDLFARYGYPNVTMTQVAELAGVADQTLYNYFPTKESLVFDKADELEAGVLAALAGCPADARMLDAFAGWLSAFVSGGDARRALASPGGMPRLAAASTGLHRALLDYAHQMAAKLAADLRHSHDVPEPAAQVRADALLALFVHAVERLGAAQGEAGLPAIAADLAASVEALRPLFPPPPEG